MKVHTVEIDLRDGAFGVPRPERTAGGDDRAGRRR